ncbi:hypothetical protein NDU88_000814 [Pleurodeles waltl]|uniref:Uncharacterized protein n=1 Tax=Pleurodeles waltl TaxID=8319 RepID=A0AAV7VX42_PLEWA|nr:hypothetical protein NDU88_000814 [Pleurodeles waltl]
MTKEIVAAIDSLVDGKAPGSDGFTAELCRAYIIIIAPQLLEVYVKASAFKVYVEALEAGVCLFCSGFRLPVGLWAGTRRRARPVPGLQREAHSACAGCLALLRVPGRISLPPLVQGTPVSAAGGAFGSLLGPWPPEFQCLWWPMAWCGLAAGWRGLGRRDLSRPRGAAVVLRRPGGGRGRHPGPRGP